MFTERDRLILNDIHRRLVQMSATANSLSAEITALQTAVATETTVNQSAITLINGFAGQLAAAVAAATAAGATADQLSTLSSLQAQITTSADALAAAVTANTSAATPAACWSGSGCSLSRPGPG